MVIIGEKLNSSIPGTLTAMEARDADFISKLAKAQAMCGANYLDINSAMCDNEVGTLVWAANIAMEATNIPIMVDSPNPETIAGVFGEMELKKCIINSVTLEENRLNAILPLVKAHDTGIVAMPISGGGMPKDADERVNNARELVAILNAEGIANSRIYVDMVVEAVGAAWEAPSAALKAAQILREEFPDLHLLAGLSNISYGLPIRKLINSAFLCCALSSGIDSAIMDATSKELILTARAAEAALGRDEFCMDYLTSYRNLYEQ